MAEITCGGCGAPLGHINLVCDVCLPNFYSALSAVVAAPASEIRFPHSGMTIADAVKVIDAAAPVEAVNGMETFTAFLHEDQVCFREAKPMTGYSGEGAWVRRTEAADRIGTLTAKLDEARYLAANLKLQAQGHASEARGANTTIYEIYQIVTGGKGEPGNWHGAEPVRKYVETAEARIAELETALKPFAEAIERYEDHWLEQTESQTIEPDDEKVSYLGWLGECFYMVTLGDFRRARALSKSEPVKP